MASILSSSALVLSSSDSESDGEGLIFSIDAFKKYGATAKPGSFSNNASVTKSFQLSSSLNPGVTNFKDSYVNVHPEGEKSSEQIKRRKNAMQKDLDENLKKSLVCQPGFEKMEKQPTFLSRRQKTKQRLKLRDKTKGFQWYNMPAPELTEEKKNDLMVLQMRQSLDPKHFYKRGINKTLPKYFQIGTVIESPLDFYSSRIPKKQRKQTLVDELLADAEFRQYQKRKVAEAMKLQPAKYYPAKRVKKTKLLEARFADTKKKHKKGKKN